MTPRVQVSSSHMKASTGPRVSLEMVREYTSPGGKSIGTSKKTAETNIATNTLMGNSTIRVAATMPSVRH